MMGAVEVQTSSFNMIGERRPRRAGAWCVQRLVIKRKTALLESRAMEHSSHLQAQRKQRQPIGLSVFFINGSPGNEVNDSSKWAQGYTAAGPRAFTCWKSYKHLEGASWRSAADLK